MWNYGFSENELEKMPAWRQKIYLEMIPRLAAREDMRGVLVRHADPKQLMRSLRAQAAGVSKKHEMKAKHVGQKFMDALRAHGAKVRRKK